MIDGQTIFNAVLAVAGFFGGFILTGISKKLEQLDMDIRKMPQQYVTKEDNRDQLQRIENEMQEIKKTCQRIFDKLDQKADK